MCGCRTNEDDMMSFIIKGFRTIVFIFIVISTTFRALMIKIIKL